MNLNILIKWAEERTLKLKILQKCLLPDTSTTTYFKQAALQVPPSRHFHNLFQAGSLKGWAAGTWDSLILRLQAPEASISHSSQHFVNQWGKRYFKPQLLSSELSCRVSEVGGKKVGWEEFRKRALGSLEHSAEWRGIWLPSQS